MNPSEPPRGIQTLVHFLEEGAGRLWLRRLLAVIVLVAAVGLYQINEARNFAAPDAMDAAQLARNLAEGRGYTTGFIRPLSLHLLQDQATAHGLDSRAVLTQPHPDLEHPPVYPVLLAALFKVMPASARYALPADQFYRRPYAEVAISALNLGLFVGVILLVGVLGWRLFDSTVGILAAFLTLGTEAFWRFANSGLPTVFLMVLLLALAHLLVSFDRRASSADPSLRRLGRLTAAAGGLIGVAFLTRYSYGWLVLPVAGFVMWRGGAGRGRLVLLLLVAVTLISAPWVARNWRLSGVPFGTAGYALFSGTETFSGDRLERSQHPDFSRMDRVEPMRKLVRNLGEVVRDEIPRLGSSWLTAFFLVGLLAPFRDPTLNRLRWFTVATLAVFAVVQAAGRTWLTTAFGSFTGENLLVTLAPLAFVFGAGVISLLLDQIEWPAPLARQAALAGLVLLFSGPFLLAILPPRTPALVDPPYRPAVIREFAGFTPPGTLFMSDIPWAMAWYGPRDAVWATLRVQDSPEANVGNRREDFFVFAEARRPVQAVYISPHWADQPLRARFLADPDFAWGRFYLDVVLRQNIPPGFPLKNVLGGSYMVNGHFLLADREYWKQGGR